MSVITITKENFENEVINSDTPVIIDFWAAWCGYCTMIAPMLEEIAAENADLKVGKINVDEQPELAEKFNIMSLPSLVVFKNGEITNKALGAMPKEQILQLLN